MSPTPNPAPAPEDTPRLDYQQISCCYGCLLAGSNTTGAADEASLTPQQLERCRRGRFPLWCTYYDRGIHDMSTGATCVAWRSDRKPG